MSILKAAYCPQCGDALDTRPVEGNVTPYCSACDRPILQLPVACADTVVFDGTNVLLIERSNPPNAGVWSLPGGIVETGESPATGAARELGEETGLSVEAESLRLCDSYGVETRQGWYNAGFCFGVEAGEATGSLTPGSDARNARFWPVETARTTDGALRDTPDDATHIESAADRLSVSLRE